MTLDYQPAIIKGSLHRIEINGDKLETTRQKEVINFAKARITSRLAWKYFRQSLKTGERLQINGGHF